jgi:ATP/maltotriose-dependent transcriptional regulator MalT
MRWCATLREGLLYPGLCRVYWVELACLRGAWSEAEVEARRACAELAAHDQRYAGTAFYLVGELRRLQGDVAGAEEAFDRAHKLGSSPQPGLSRVRLQQGRAADALAALRSALAPGPTAPLPRAQLLSALVEVAAGVGEMAEAERAADELGALAEASGSRLLDGLRSAALGQLSAARGDHRSALADRRRALRTFQELGLPYEAARQQVELAVAAEAVGDNETARLELEAAVTTFERLEAPVDVERARCLLDPGAVGAAGDASPAPSAPRRLASGSRPGRRIVADRGAEPASAPAAMPAVLPEAGSEAGERSPLSGRELDVLRLVADGKTNRDIAETLILSPHTVARHVSNIFTKLGVGSRAAATASAYELGLLGTAPEPD